MCVPEKTHTQFNSGCMSQNKHTFNLMVYVCPRINTLNIIVDVCHRINTLNLIVDVCPRINTHSI